MMKRERRDTSEQRAGGERFNEDEVIALGAIVGEAVVLKYPSEISIMHRPESGHRVTSSSC